MNSLHNDASLQDPKKVTIFPTALLYGVLGGIVIIVYTFLNYETFFAISNLGGAISGFFIQASIWFGMVILAIRKHRKDLGGYISMGRCLGLGIVIVIIATILYVVFSYIYSTVINPEIEKQLIEKMSWFFEMVGMDEDQIETAIQTAPDVELSNLPYTLFASIFSGGILGLIVSAITGAVMRKNRPDTQ
jgi:hypothetical protein